MSNLPSGDPATWPNVITRSYKGKPDAANAAFAAEAATLAEYGYLPTSQFYAQGSRGCLSFLIALALILAIGFGLLILAYLLIVKPAGTLTVTYTRSDP